MVGQLVRNQEINRTNFYGVQLVFIVTCLTEAETFAWRSPQVLTVVSRKSAVGDRGSNVFYEVLEAVLPLQKQRFKISSVKEIRREQKSDRNRDGAMVSFF